MNPHTITASPDFKSGPLPDSDIPPHFCHLKFYNILAAMSRHIREVLSRFRRIYIAGVLKLLWEFFAGIILYCCFLYYVCIMSLKTARKNQQT